jgi:TolB protein
VIKQISDEDVGRIFFSSPVSLASFKREIIMRTMFKLLSILILLFAVTAEARIYIPVNQPSDQLFPIAIPDLKGGGKGRKIAEIIRNDMRLSGYFDVLPESVLGIAGKEGIALGDIRFSYWAGVGAQALVKGQVESKGGQLIITIRLFDPYGKEMLVGKQYKADSSNMRKVAHRFSNEIMEALTGVRGVFNTKIAFAAVSGKKSKEIFVMDMDGYKPFSVTKNKSINISPSFSPNGGSVVFTSYMRGNPDIYVSKIGGGSLRRLSSGKGSNLTPAWSPLGNPIAFASSANSLANLYTVSSTGRGMHRLTRNYNIDISPSWSPGGESIVFASERAGGLHLFKTSAAGGGTERLTFVGYQNDMPDWSPMGDKIAFAGRDMGTFDIFIMNPDGSNIQRLTIATGSNEHPTFSPDGRLIAFSSTREGGASLYIMRADGTNQTRVSKGNGILPDWGPQVE